MAKVAVAGVVALLLAPASALLGLGALLSPAAQAQCLPAASTATSTTAAPSVPETSHVAFPLPRGRGCERAASGCGSTRSPVSTSCTPASTLRPRAARTSSPLPTAAWRSPAPPRASGTSS